MEEAPSSPPSPTPHMAEAPSSPPSPTPQIRKRDGRGISKLPAGRLTITEVSDVGVPLSPPAIAARFRTVCGILAREKVPITTPKWKSLTKDQRRVLWEDLSSRFTIPETHMRRVQRHALLSMCHAWRTFKSVLVTQYVNKSETPFTRFPFLTRETWDAFVAMKTTDEFKEQSAAHKAIQARNTHPHRLGTAGYAAKSAQWEAEENPFPDITHPRSLSWLQARAKVSSDGSVTFPNPTDQEVSQRVVNISNYLVVYKSITS